MRKVLHKFVNISYNNIYIINVFDLLCWTSVILNALIYVGNKDIEISNNLVENGEGAMLQLLFKNDLEG